MNRDENNLNISKKLHRFNPFHVCWASLIISAEPRVEMWNICVKISISTANIFSVKSRFISILS